MKRITLALTMAALLTGCSTSEPSSPPAAPPAGVSVSLAQYRSDEPVHTLQVAVRNTTDTPVYFADVQLVTPSFATLPPQRADATIKRTQRTDLRIPYGAAKCSPQGLPEVQPATVVAHVSTGSEQPRKVIFPVPHPDPLLVRLLRDECSEFLIKQAASIEFGPDWQESGKVMRGNLIVTRRGPGAVTLTDMGGTTHYLVTQEHRPLGVLQAAAQQLTVPIALTPARCDGHAFAEAKKAFLFPVRASIDGGEERVVIVAPPKPLQDRLITYALKACGLGGG
ncbi:lipoprotein [Nonomuraea sp. H19]|uniref:lipoprotein n=1 Tax=Nonomuraea sp. H19 TaxID=3452206 RepID=UPI003F8C7736